MRLRSLPLLCALASLLAACGGDSAVEPETEPDTQTRTDTVTAEPGGETLSERCESPEAGYAVGYPEGWHTNDGSAAAPCSFFHPEAFTLPEASEPPPLAVSIAREPVAFADVTSESPATRVLASEQLEVDGRPAVRRETESTGEGLLPEGVQSLEVLVDLDGETLIVATRSLGGLDFARNREVLDEMVATLELG